MCGAKSAQLSTYVTIVVVFVDVGMAAVQIE